MIDSLLEKNLLPDWLLRVGIRRLLAQRIRDDVDAKIAEIAAIAFHNKALLYDLLFKTASQTMLTIAADPKHLGARIGITVLLAAIVWWDFLVGHVLNNIRGLA